MPVTKRLRYEILRRDNHTAQFGFGIKELFVDVIERCRYLDDEQKRDAQFYITRMISQSFESVRTS